MTDTFERPAAFRDPRADPGAPAGEVALVAGVPADLARSVDLNGSLITVDPATWMVCFVPGLAKQWWHRFADDRHKHVFAMRPLENGDWLLVESWWTRLWVCVLPSPQAMRYLRWAGIGDIVRMKEEVPGEGNQLRGWSNCAVLAAFVLGRKSKSWTPHGLYLELLKDGGVVQDVEELVVAQVKTVLDAKRAEVLDVDAAIIDRPLSDLLVHIGRNIMQAFMSPGILHLNYTAIVEAERFPKITEAYHEHGMAPALELLRGIMARAGAAGEIAVGDPARAADQFMAMLHGTMHLDAAIGLRGEPTIDEIEAQVRSVVAIFLHGVSGLRAAKATDPLYG